MAFLVRYLIGRKTTCETTVFVLMLFHAGQTLKPPADALVEEYCMTEQFQPRCPKNEAIRVTSAIYGRMRTGRCVTAEEVAAHRNILGEDTQYFGCSADVLPMLDRKCSGKNECDVRLSDFSAENIKPCFPGLTVFLEVSYECMSVLDADRSCSTVLSSNPVHVIGSVDSQGKCGTNSEPWNIGAPVGQKISASILDFTSAQFGHSRQEGQVPCYSRVIIMDRAGKKNTSICVGGGQRKETFLSSGNAVEISFNWSQPKNTNSDSDRFILELEAVGCLDLIPPKDAWLKRNGDTIVVGCYASRNSWQLKCKEGNWIGVFGNCSQDISVYDSVVEPDRQQKGRWSDGQVVAMVAIGGVTLAICLAILCIAAVCLNKFSAKKKKQDYKTLDFQYRLTDSTATIQGTRTGISGNVVSGAEAQLVPTYSVFVGESDIDLANQLTRVGGPTPRAPLS